MPSQTRDFLIHHKITVALLVSCIAGSLWLSLVATPEDVIAFLGVENAYVLMAALGFLSGAMTLSGIPYHLVLVGFASAGPNPFLLAVAATVGVALGDCISYLLGYHSHGAVPKGLRRMLLMVRDFAHRHPRLMPLMFFAYGALVPFSNDLIGLTMGLARYSIVRVMLPLALGTLVFNTTIAYFGASIYALIFG